LPVPVIPSGHRRVVAQVAGGHWWPWDRETVAHGHPLQPSPSATWGPSVAGYRHRHPQRDRPARCAPSRAPSPLAGTVCQC